MGLLGKLNVNNKLNVVPQLCSIIQQGCLAKTNFIFSYLVLLIFGVCWDRKQWLMLLLILDRQQKLICGSLDAWNLFGRKYIYLSTRGKNVLTRWMIHTTKHARHVRCKCRMGSSNKHPQGSNGGTVPHQSSPYLALEAQDEINWRWGHVFLSENHRRGWDFRRSVHNDIISDQSGDYERDEPYASSS